MNQSIFSMITAAASKTDFHSRFDDDSDASADEGDTTTTTTEGSKTPSVMSGKSQDVAGDKKEKVKGKSKLSQSSMLRGLPKLSVRPSKSKKLEKGQSTDLSSSTPALAEPTSPRDAPVMSRMLVAQAQLNPTSLGMGVQEHEEDEEDEEVPAKTVLAKRLMEIFHFKEAEEVISGRLALAEIKVERALILGRVPVLAPQERPPSRLPLHHR
jgi:sterol 3beta-glucosyltransferase